MDFIKKILGFFSSTSASSLLNVDNSKSESHDNSKKTIKDIKVKNSEHVNISLGDIHNTDKEK